MIRSALIWLRATYERLRRKAKTLHWIPDEGKADFMDSTTVFRICLFIVFC